MATKKIVLDTSVQIGKFKYKEIEDLIKKYKTSHKVYSLFYVFFEFKVVTLPPEREKHPSLVRLV
jgi:hypothetical protein